jgi:hypothetical protein
MRKLRHVSKTKNFNNKEKMMMMKPLKMILVALVMASMMAASVTMAQPQNTDMPGPAGLSADGEQQAPGDKPMKPRPRGPLGLFAKFQHQNLTITVLSELTGLEEDSIYEELEFSHPSDILFAYGIDMEIFIAAMDEHVIAFVESAVTAGTLTADQGDQIITMILEKPERPERPEPPEEGEMP